MSISTNSSNSLWLTTLYYTSIASGIIIHFVSRKIETKFYSLQKEQLLGYHYNGTRCVLYTHVLQWRLMAYIHNAKIIIIIVYRPE